MERKLDRLPSFDERSRNFRTLVAGQTPRSYTWAAPPVNQIPLDQGQEGACVGFGFSHEAACRPVVEVGIDNDFAFGVYHRAQQIDEWPGEDYDGTSVLAGAKVMLERGMLIEYRWAFGLDDVLATVSRRGPVVLGINWYEQMFEPDDANYLHVGGDVAGGHAIACVGVNVAFRRVTLLNSWGSAWGRNGRAYLPWDDLDRLLHEQGDACVPIRRRLH